MSIVVKIRSRSMAARVFCIALACSFGVVGCGTRSAQPLTVSVSSVNRTGAIPADSNGVPTTQGGAGHSQVSSMVPAFEPSIHDYVIKCADLSTIQLTVGLPQNLLVGFIGPTGTAIQPASYPAGQFQQQVSMLPGQRIQFSLSNQSENYSVRCLPADFPALSVSGPVAAIGILKDSSSTTPQAQWYLFTPDLQLNASTPGPASYVIIADRNGTPVWWYREPLGTAIDAKVLVADEIIWAIQSQGTYVFHDFSGSIINTLLIPGNFDIHDLQPTSAGTYFGIRTVYRVCPPDCADMSVWGGSSQAGVLDAEIVEVDKQSNILWTWKTRDHIALGETGESGWFPAVGLDIIHMNAVEPDGVDGLMFSARHLNAIYHITKSTGAIDWKLGGTLRPESLVVVGDTRPTALGPSGKPLSGQHDIRRLDDGTISLHDNGTIAGRAPFVLRYRVDLSSRTAEVVEEFSDNRVQSSACCGSARRLPGGNWVVEWGAQSFLTEVDSHGVPVLTISYSAASPIFSYRAVPISTGLVSADSLRFGMDAIFLGQ